MKLRREAQCYASNSGLNYKDRVTVHKEIYEGVPAFANQHREFKLDLKHAKVESQYLDYYSRYLMKLTPEEKALAL